MSAARPLAKTLGAPSHVQGIAFDAGTDLFFGLDDRLTACVIPHDQQILGVPCARGLVHFHPSGQLAQATLADDLEHRGARFERGTLLSWSEDGTLVARLAAAHRIGDVELPPGTKVELCPEGRLVRWSRPIEAEEIHDGLPCAAHSKVTFFGDGSLARATAARDVSIGGLPALGGADVELHPGGGVSVVTLGAPYRRAGCDFELGTTLVFRRDGSLSVAHLADELTLGGRHFEAGSYLQFDTRERLVSHSAITWTVAGRAPRGEAATLPRGSSAMVVA